MKKLLSVLLAAIMVLSAAMLMTACGGDAGEDAAAEGEQQTEVSEAAAEASETVSEDAAQQEGGSVFPAALSGISAIQVPALDATGWQLSGGMIDGVEMEEADVAAVLEACGGVFQFVFPGEGAIQMVNGEQAFDGTYELVEDNFAIHAVFDGYEYYGVFTEVEGQTIMILVNTKESEKALYMAHMSEG